MGDALEPSNAEQATWSDMTRDYVADLLDENERLQARVRTLETALSELLHAEWMVTHDWGGDRDPILEKGWAALGESDGD